MTIQNLNRSITYNEIETVIKILPTNKIQGSEFSSEFYQIFKEGLMTMLLKLVHEIEMKGIFQNSLYKVSITLIPKPDEHTSRKESDRPVFLMNLHAKTLFIYFFSC